MPDTLEKCVVRLEVIAAHGHIPVAVDRGTLFAAAWGIPTDAAVVAVHGITANHAAWQWVGPELGEGLCLLAPDLRGRGASSDVAGPYGIERHAADTIAVLDAVGADQAVLVGHSMGAYVVAVAAARYPDRVRAVVLIDGGISLPFPPGADPDELMAAILGPALARLDMSFPNEDAYFDYWKAHPAFADPEQWKDGRLKHYLRCDLGGDPPVLKSRVAREAVVQDGRDVLLSAAVATAPDSIDGPVALLRASRGPLDEPSPLFPDSLVEAIAPRFTDLNDRLVPDVNHYSIVMGDGAAVVVDTIHDLAG